ncbi:MAG TPA: hypothetical protein VF881_11700 [Polyangiaceae bacterium]
MIPAPDVLLVSAHLPELSGFRSILGEDLHKSVAGRNVVAAAVGIGIVSAAAGTAALLERSDPSAVILVGTCGAYLGRGHAIGDVIVARRLHLVSAAEVEGKGAFPGPMTIATDIDLALSTAFAECGAAETRLATTLAVTTDDALAHRIATAHACDVEHLEAFGVAWACSKSRTPFGVVLGVANMVGATAREEWKRHHDAAGSSAAALVARWLTSGAPGLPLRT